MSLQISSLFQFYLAGNSLFRMTFFKIVLTHTMKRETVKYKSRTGIFNNNYNQLKHTATNMPEREKAE